MLAMTLLKQAAVLVVLAAAVTYFAIRARRLYRLLRLGPNENRFDHIPLRLLGVAKYVGLHSRMFRNLYSGILHFFIFYGFVVLLTAIIEAFGEGLYPGFSLAWIGGDHEAVVRKWMRTLARRAIEGLEACGIPADRNGTLASSRRFSRSVDEWRRAALAWAGKLDYEAVIIMSTMADGRPVWPADVVGSRLFEAFLKGPDHEQLRRRLAIIALAHRPPTGFVHDFVVEHSGARKGLLDIKHRGLQPIVDLARWAVVAAEVPGVTSTVARLDAAEAAGSLQAADAAPDRPAARRRAADRSHRPEPPDRAHTSVPEGGVPGDRSRPARPRSAHGLAPGLNRL